MKRRTLSFVSPPPKRQSNPGPEEDSQNDSDDVCSRSDTPMSVQAGEQLLDTSDFSILYELSDELESDGSSVVATSIKGDQDETEVLVRMRQVLFSKALLSRIELLESENKKLQLDLKCQKPKFFRIENISHNELVRFYTGFSSFEILQALFEFLGPGVSNLTY